MLSRIIPFWMPKFLVYQKPEFLKTQHSQDFDQHYLKFKPCLDQISKNNVDTAALFENINNCSTNGDISQEVLKNLNCLKNLSPDQKTKLTEFVGEQIKVLEEFKFNNRFSNEHIINNVLHVDRKSVAILS